MSNYPHRVPRWITALASALFIASLGLAATPSMANDCVVKPFEAYQAAVKRGWRFFCDITALPAGVTHSLLLPEPQGTVLCQWRTAPIPQPTPPRGQMRFFVKGSGDVNTLRNGWRIKSYEITGGQYTKFQPSNSARLLAGSMLMDKPNRTFNYRLSKLVLTKANGVCNKAIDEAF